MCGCWMKRRTGPGGCCLTGWCAAAGALTVHACTAALLARRRAVVPVEVCSAPLLQAEQGLNGEPEPVEGRHADDAAGPSTPAGTPEGASSAAQGQAMSGVRLGLPVVLMPSAWRSMPLKARALMLLWWGMHAAEEPAGQGKRTGRTAWRQEALQQLQPARAPEVDGLQGVEGDARMVLDAAAVLGVRHDLISSTAARWRALTQQEDLPA